MSGDAKRRPAEKPLKETIRKGDVGHNPPPKDPPAKPTSGVSEPKKK